MLSHVVPHWQRIRYSVYGLPSSVASVDPYICQEKMPSKAYVTAPWNSLRIEGNVRMRVINVRRRDTLFSKNHLAKCIRNCPSNLSLRAAAGKPRIFDLQYDPGRAELALLLAQSWIFCA
jgi:hypothetical protein